MNGFGILYSFADSPSFAYTAGIEESWHHPEIIVFGLDYESSTRLITEAVELIKTGTFFPNQIAYYTIGDVKVRFVEVAAGVALQYLCETAAYYGEKKFRVLQMLWPDGQGRFPFEPECSVEVKRTQPVISELTRS
ncbi:MAG TPA: DUF4262 domain-containing protein [Dissulfurispiraceae bacterium]|nr:DUF4262 domain-containing protein [Dissulfurispiraceae bacterium]